MDQGQGRDGSSQIFVDEPMLTQVVVIGLDSLYRSAESQWGIDMRWLMFNVILLGGAQGDGCQEFGIVVKLREGRFFVQSASKMYPIIFSASSTIY